MKDLFIKPWAAAALKRLKPVLAAVCFICVNVFLAVRMYPAKVLPHVLLVGCLLSFFIGYAIATIDALPTFEDDTQQADQPDQP